MRIREYREKGYTTKGAVVKGLTKTGSLITSAGLIMFVAFGGLLFSSILALNQLSFFLAVAVLFDTFVIRTLFIPSVFSILERLFGERVIWFPSKMKEVSGKKFNYEKTIN